MTIQIKWRPLAVFCLALMVSAQAGQSGAPAKKNAAKAPKSASGAIKITGLNPRGNPPAIKLIPMASRLDTLEGKTVYFVDDGFQGGDTLLKEMIAWFNQNMPKVKTEFRKKAGGFDGEDPKLMAELKEKGDAMVMATGH
jgi:hypothetical protein